ncbi:hypothetical protein N0V88_001522 [Collariella sp. IMI 366227]|nr:hypothetical protein N0V88_001522 [Collariella sp. IMI 366227]
MPLTLPSSPTPSAQPAPTLHPQSDSNNDTPTWQSRLLPTLDTSTTRGKSVTAIILLRAFYNLVHLVIYTLGGSKMRWLPWLFNMVWHFSDQLVVVWCPLDTFLIVMALLHVLYMVLLVVLIFSGAIFFGITGSWIMTVIGVVVVLGAFVASRPEREEGTLRLPF